MGPEYPIYIVSKGRSDSRLTVKALEAMRVPYRVIVEEAELETYAAVIAREHLLVLDPSYQREYDTADGLAGLKSKGPGPARNFAWDHAVTTGARRHWVMDDNISGFYRLNLNLKTPVVDGTIFRCMEVFVDRYENVAMAGPNYFMFAARKQRSRPFVLNTRIYSCNLIRNDLPYRWRGRYNEDTDLSLRMLKDGWCTVQFNAFLQYKVPTQTISGGNTQAFYAFEGTKRKSEMLERLHPDVARQAYRFHRDHHHVDYGPFKANKLLRRAGLARIAGVNNFGMRLEQQVDGVWHEIQRWR